MLRMASSFFLLFPRIIAILDLCAILFHMKKTRGILIWLLGVSLVSTLFSCSINMQTSTSVTPEKHDILTSKEDYQEKLEEKIASGETQFYLYRNFSLPASEYQALQKGLDFGGSYITINYSLGSDYRDLFNITYKEYASVASADKTSISPCHDIGADGFSKANCNQDSLMSSLPIDSITDKVKVDNSEELYYWAMKGKQPEISTSNEKLTALYSKIRGILLSLIGNGTSDKAKVTAIYDYLANNVRYDFIGGKVTSEAYKQDCYYLEGVFNSSHAVCDGYSKAFALMCAMEGINAPRVSGTVKERNATATHSWNYVKVDGSYYKVDATASNLSYSVNDVNYEVSNHDFLFFIGNTVDGREYSQTSHSSYTEASASLNYYWTVSQKFGTSAFSWNDSSSLVNKERIVLEALLAEETGLYSYELPKGSISEFSTAFNTLKGEDTKFATSKLSLSMDDTSETAYFIYDNRA